MIFFLRVVNLIRHFSAFLCLRLIYNAVLRGRTDFISVFIILEKQVENDHLRSATVVLGVSPMLASMCR